MCAAKQRGLEAAGLEVVGVSLWGLLKSADAGSGSQGLCEPKLLRSPEPLVSLPVIELIPRRFFSLISSSEGPDPGAAAIEGMNASDG